MASFQKRGPSWQYTISRMVNGESKPLRKSGFRTKKEAQIAAAQAEAELNKGIVVINKNIIFAEYFEEWYQRYKKNVTKSTLTHYAYTLKAIKSFFNYTVIQNITKNDYQDFLNDFGANKSRETVEKVHIHIRACVMDAVDDSIIRVDFTRKAVVTGNVPAKKPSEKHLNYIESKLLAKELYKRLDTGMGYYLLLLGLVSGLRFAELVGLTRDDFDFENNVLAIDKTWGYSNKMHEGFGPTKNIQSIRNVKIDKSTMDVFKKLLDETTDKFKGLVFYSPTSKYKVISNTNANKLLRKVLNDLGISTKITVHGLRHTHASVLLYKRISIYYISERLGHSDIQTTLKDYSHVIKELREEDELNTIQTFEDLHV